MEGDRIQIPGFLRKPYFIPGYMGHCPTYETESVGKTYGKATHDILKRNPFITTRLQPMTEDERRKRARLLSKKQKPQQQQQQQPRQQHVSSESEDESNEVKTNTSYNQRMKTKKCHHRYKRNNFNQIESDVLPYEEPDGIISITHVLEETRHYIPKKLETSKMKNAGHKFYGNGGGGDQGHPHWIRSSPQYSETYFVHKWFEDEPSFSDKKRHERCYNPPSSMEKVHDRHQQFKTPHTGFRNGYYGTRIWNGHPGCPTFDVLPTGFSAYGNNQTSFVDSKTYGQNSNRREQMKTRWAV